MYLNSCLIKLSQLQFYLTTEPNGDGFLSPHAGCVNDVLAQTPDIVAVPGSCNLRNDVAYEVPDSNSYPFAIAFPAISAVEPPFCFSTIFDLDLMNGTNDFDTIVSLGYRLESDVQALIVPFKVEVGPSVRVTYANVEANFPYVARLGKGVFSYLTVCVESAGGLNYVISAYIRGCEVNSLSPINITGTGPTDFPVESGFVYLGEDQAPFEVLHTFLRL